MKTYLIALILFVLSVHPALAGKKSDKEQERLVGPVKTVLIEFTKISNEKGKPVESARTPWLSNTYDLKGNRVQEDQLYEDVALNFKSVFTYDPTGNLKEGIEYDYKGFPTFKWTYTFDPEQNRLEERRTQVNGVLFSKVLYTYDRNGNLIEEVRQQVQSTKDFKWVYLYDAEGRKVEENFYLVQPQDPQHEAVSTLDFKTLYRYDAKGTLVEETRFDAAGAIRFKKQYTYKFDSVGNWIAQTAEEWITRSDKTTLEPTGVTYRTIAYHSP
ncbi:MAG: hypothetical protein HY282_01305 [Nitrospirae bacterium]|nr:hypothetical protein [Candidatus Manganitrophaceae bacterium]